MRITHLGKKGCGDKNIFIRFAEKVSPRARFTTFESASDLTKTALETLLTLFFFCFVRHLYGNDHIDVISQINVTILSLIVSPNS